jgi:hypothetical protein
MFSARRPPYGGRIGRERIRVVSITGMVRALVRRWYVLAVFALLTVVAAVIVPRSDGVYWSQVSVVFLAPITPLNPNSLTLTPDALVNFTAVVERTYNGSGAHDQFASPAATLYGAGIREGSTVSLVNGGGQWSRAYYDPVLVVDVVDSSESVVRAEVARIVAKIEGIARERQAESGVSETNFITTLQSPEAAAVGYTEGNRPRAMLGIMTLGAIVGTSVALLVDIGFGLLRRRAAK